MQWKKVFNKASFRHFLKTLRYALYVITHPMDGFWDLTHEKRGSLAAANFIVVLTLLTRVWKLQYTGFMFNRIQWEYVNIFMEMAAIAIPLAIWCVSNWSLTTLFDGKGSLKNIYMGTAYALTPYPLIQIPCIIASNFITEDEGAFYTYLTMGSLIWAGLLIMCAMSMIHDYSMKKTLLFILLSLVGMVVIIFLLTIFFSLISDAVAYFVSLYKELVFRLY